MLWVDDALPAISKALPILISAVDGVDPGAGDRLTLWAVAFGQAVAISCVTAPVPHPI